LFYRQGPLRVYGSGLHAHSLHRLRKRSGLTCAAERQYFFLTTARFEPGPFRFRSPLSPFTAQEQRLLRLVKPVIGDL
jgi:hypothetical protein